MNAKIKLIEFWIKLCFRGNKSYYDPVFVLVNHFLITKKPSSHVQVIADINSTLSLFNRNQL